jgi:hypothetical protein
MDENSGNQTNPESQPIPGAVFSPSNNSTDLENSQPITESTLPSSQADGHYTNNEQSESQPINTMSTELAESDEGLSWFGPQFVSHDKTYQWYLACVAAALVLGGLTYLLTSRDLISSITVTLAIIILGFYSLRKPKNIAYGLSSRGVSIGSKNFAYEELRAFTAVIEGDYLNINLLPLKRFGPPLGLCYKGSEESMIVDFLAERLPMDQHKPDLLDSLLLRMRF